MSVAEQRARPVDDTAVPADFVYHEAINRPAIRRLRAAWRAVLRFDPCPPAAVVDAFVKDMHTGDPVAEQFVDDVFFGPAGPRAGRNLLDRALADGIASIEDPPPAMQRLFDEFETVPDWVDPELVEQGAAIWRRWGTDLFRVAGAETLEMYTESAVAVPLSLAGGYAGDAALRRFLETARFWIDTSEPGALLTPGSAGRATALRVRVMHVSVRRRVAEHPEWDYDRWGLPISQAYMMLTLMGGSVSPAMLMWPMGYLTTPSEIRALMHHQLYLGHLLGVHPRSYPKNVREGVQMLFMAAVARSYTAGAHGAELIESFPRAFQPKGDGSPLKRLRDAYEYRLISALVALMMHPATRARHDMPPAFPWVGLAFARVPGRLVAETARRLVPGVDGMLDRRARAARERWHATQMGGHEAAFEAGGLRR